MSVNFRFSTQVSGEVIRLPIDFSDLSNTGGESEIPLYIEHDSLVDLQNVGFYIQPFAGVGYQGIYGEMTDYLQILEWGEEPNKGLRINQDATSTDTSYDVPFLGGAAGQGHTIDHAIELETIAFTATPPTVNGEFPSGLTAHCTLKLAVASTETSAGVRQVSFLIAFDV
jgi:hypothetical protein